MEYMRIEGFLGNAISKLVNKAVEQKGGHAYNCNDCPNKCEEWHQWDKEEGDEDA